MNVWGSVFVIVVATNWLARECRGSSWVVVSKPGAAASLPSCPSYCLQGYTGARSGVMAGLYWCAGLGTRLLHEQWSFNASLFAFFLEDDQGSQFCLDIGDIGDIMAGVDTSQVPLDTARSLVLSNCNSSSPTQKWAFDGAGRLTSLAGPNASYASPYQIPGRPDVFFLSLLLEGTFAAQSSAPPFVPSFVTVDISRIASYYTPPLPANNQSNLILNGKLKLLTSFAPFMEPSPGTTETDWTDPGTVWDGFYFILCHWEVHGGLTAAKCSGGICQLPKQWCSGSNYDEMLLFLNKINDDQPGWIMQTVPTYPGSNYLLLFETKNPRNRIQKLRLSVSSVVTSTSANGIVMQDFEILQNQIESQTHQFQFIASGNFTNVSFASRETSECGPLIDNIQLYYWPQAAPEQSEYHVKRAGRLILVVTIAGWVLAATECSGAAFYIASNLWRKRHGKPILQVQITVFSYEQLKAYTENFSNLIGEGGFGKVYFGRLPKYPHQAIAVKRQNNADDASFFKAEVALLTRVHHRYIVKFLGYCEDKGERMLVFEFMANKCLHSRLHGELATPLSWKERLRIAYQVAYALEYLHNGSNPPVLHRDVKAANVLLSDTMVAKLADMGISKVGRPDVELEGPCSTSTMTVLKGSRGYLDPYYLQTSRISHKSDVYSFGVLLLEIVTGRKAITADGELLTAWAKRIYWDDDLSRNDGKQNIILDYRLHGNDICDANVKAVMEIVRSCVYEEPCHRPCMVEVARRLREQLASSCGVTHLHMDEFSMGTNDDTPASSSNDTSIIFGR